MVKLEGVSKKFCHKLKRSLLYGIEDLAGELIARRGNPARLRRDEFLALDDVSFEVRRGEMLGLVGQNGAGKSTLLKMLNGLIRPDAGQVTLRGRVQALIELGAGFSPILTGRENIYVNAAVLGIPKAQVDEIFPEIVEFAGIGDFIDAPVQNYSSGMKARLGFAVVAQLDPDVLLIDEVLAVGDTAFQEKCMRRMDALRQSNRAIIFVTHSLFQVEALCNKAVWLEKGKVAQVGPAGEVVRAYLDHQERLAMAESRAEGVEYEGRGTAATRAYFDAAGAGRSGHQKHDGSAEPGEIRTAEVRDSGGRASRHFSFLYEKTVAVHFYSAQRIRRPLFHLRFSQGERRIFEAGMLINGHGPEWIEGDGVVDCQIKRLPLTPGVYNVLLIVRSHDGVADLATMRVVAQFRVTDPEAQNIPLLGPMALTVLRMSPVYVENTWRLVAGEHAV